MMLLTGLALAQTVTFDAERFHPAVTGDLLGVPTAWVDDAEGLGGRVVAGWSDDPLVWRNDDGTDTRIVGTRAGAELGVRYQVDRLAFGLSLPSVVTDGDFRDPGFSLGDTRFDVLGRLFGGPTAALAATVSVRFPTGDALGWTGAPGVSAAGALVGSFRVTAIDGEASATAGIDSESRWEVPTFRWGPQLTWSAAWRQGLPAGVRAFLEVDGGVPLRTGAGPPPGEWRLGVGHALGPGLDLRGAVGRGYTRGVGNPDARVVVSLTLAPPARTDPR
jgi:hypothetical protein